MASHRSAEKRTRQAIRRTARNTHIKSGTKKLVRRFQRAVGSGDAAEMATTLAAACRALRRAASKGVLHPRTAARRVGRLAAAHHRAGASAQG